MDLLTQQLADIQRRYPLARLEAAPGGARVLVVPDVPVCPGWNQASTTVRVLVAVGYPHVKPDCFYVDTSLRLAASGEPAASNIQTAFGGHYRWFSWHVTSWDPTRGSLDQFLHVCESRLREAR
jgi:Prokaryotic E2 family E